MNQFEFLKLLKADPHSKDPEFLAAIHANKQNKKAFDKAIKNEQIIKKALNIPVPEFEIENIKFNQSQLKINRQKHTIFALAASLVMVVGASLFLLSNNPNSELEKFINEALMMEPAVYMSENEIPKNELEPLFASINTAIDGQLGQVHFMKLCPTLNGKGARMVLMNELNQPITVLYMPNSPVSETVNMEMQGFKGKIVALEQGSAAIIARPHENTAQIETNLLSALKPIQ